MISEVGRVSPFDIDFKKSMNVSLGDESSNSMDNLLKQVLINTEIAFPALLQGMESLNKVVTTGTSSSHNTQSLQSADRGHNGRDLERHAECTDRLMGF